MRQGEPADRFYVIADGTFRVTQQTGEGQVPNVLRELRAGDVFGEIGLLTGAARTATVTAATDGVLLALHGGLTRRCACHRQGGQAEQHARADQSYEKSTQWSLLNLKWLVGRERQVGRTPWPVSVSALAPNRSEIRARPWAFLRAGQCERVLRHCSML